MFLIFLHALKVFFVFFMFFICIKNAPFSVQVVSKYVENIVDDYKCEMNNEVEDLIKFF